MKGQPFTAQKLVRLVLGAMLAVLSGLALWAMPMGGPWVNASYDWLFRFGGARPVSCRVVLIEMDSAARAELHQTQGEPWDRTLHANLLDHLRKNGCPLVVFDLWFVDEGESESDARFVKALREYEKVVLLANAVPMSHPKMAADEVLPPHPRFRDVATNWGIGRAFEEPDHVVRRVWTHREPEWNPTLPATAARLAGANVDFLSAAAKEERWLRYYGANGLWTRVSYHLATNQAPGFYEDKIVFIGTRPLTPRYEPEDDEFMSPYTRWTDQSASGMEIMATTFLNLMNRDGLRRLVRWQEAIVLIVVGGLLGAGLSLFRWPGAASIGVGAALAVGAAGVCLSYFSNWWFPWMVVAGGQIPVAVGAACLSRRSASLTKVAEETIKMPGRQMPGTPHTPGYERIEPAFGKGGYGKVWLVRNAVGEWQALKTIFRAQFSEDGPFDREFNGIKHHKPISSQHPGLLRIDFVSAKQPEGYFYYVMELGDALTADWEQNPSLYKPRDLTSVCRLAPNQRLPALECARIGLALAESLEFLHRQGLIHRDIKPPNVIFVKGQPKLADVGLVTEMGMTGREISFVGTSGYMPPEGPGKAQGDIYSLGILLYVISTGQSADSFPEVSATAVASASEANFIRLNAIILKACDPKPAQRYASASEMRAALLELRQALDRSTSTNGA